MIGFSIMMWFAGLVMTIVAISLLRGNTSSMHGKTFEKVVDKIRFAKESGKVVLFMAIGILLSGVVALFVGSKQGILYALGIIIIFVIITAIRFISLNKKILIENQNDKA